MQKKDVMQELSLSFRPTYGIFAPSCTKKSLGLLKIPIISQQKEIK